MGTLSNKYFNAEAVETALDKGVEAYDSTTELKEDLSKVENIVYGDKYIPKLKKYNAYISSSNVWVITNQSSNCVFVPVDGGEKLKIVHKEGITFHLAFLKSFSEPVSGISPSYCDGYNSRIQIPISTLTQEYTIPSDCRFVYILMLNNLTDYSPNHFVINGYDAVDNMVNNLLNESKAYTDEKNVIALEMITENAEEISDIQHKIEKTQEVSPEIIEGYTRFATGVVTTYSASGKYVTTGIIPIGENVLSIESNFVSNAEAGYALFDENRTYITGGTDQLKISPIPSNARYISLSDYRANAIHEGLFIRYNNKPLVEIKNLVTVYGDSTIEGLGMEDISNANYGGDTMPSHLFTLLKDNGYSVEVENMGHSGERSTETCARVGGRICAYLGEDITIPSSNVAQSLGVAMINNSVVTGSKMISTGKNADGTTPTILLTKLGHHTRPVLVGDYECNIWQANQDGGMLQTIQCTKVQGKDIVLKKHSPIVFGSSKRHSDVNVVHMGINDGANMTLDEYIDRFKSIIEREPKTIVCGLYNGAWNWWRNMTGTNEEKREAYNLACLSNFGSYFINLYDIFCTSRCIDIANEGGYLLNRTQTQIDADNTAFNNGHTCPSLTYEGTENEVHFNSIGYYVFAKVVFDKIVALGLIDKM